MNKSLLIFGLLAVAGFGAVAFLAKDGPPDTQKTITEGLTAVKTEQTAAAIKIPKALSTGEFPVPAKVGPWPKVVAEELLFSFGRMPVGTSRSHSFTIQNDGAADLLLKAGTTTCKCTEFKLKSEVLKPGESTELVMSWKSGESADRAFRHGGDIHTNDPNRPLINYVVEGAIEMSFELLPTMWNVGSVTAGQPGQFQAALATRLFDNFQIVSIHSPSGFVKVNPVAMTPQQKAPDRYESGYSLQVEISDAVPAGNFTEEILINVSEQKDPIRVTVKARKYGAIRLQQMAGTLFDAEKLILQLGSFPASQGREAKMLLIVDEKEMPESFRLTATKADPPFLKATLTPLGEPTGTIHRYILTLAIPPGRPHVQRVDGKPGSLRISTNHPTGEEITMAVLVYSN